MALLLVTCAVHAQTTGDAVQRFAQMRQAAAAAYPPVGRPAAPGLPGDPIPLLDCLDVGLQLGTGDKDSDAPVIQAAMEVEQLGHTLRALRVPTEVWQPWLDRIQRLGADYLIALDARAGSAQAAQRFFDQRQALLTQLERAVVRQRQQRGAPPVVLQEGCGAGENPVEILTRPAGGRVSYITLFRHRLCEVQGIVPTDRQRCRGWIDAVKPREFLSGRYAYQVRWPDGRSRSGVFDTFATPTQDQRGDDVVRIVLSP